MTRSPRRILIADDEFTARLLLKAALEKAGFSVTMAADGEEALRQFGARPCDMVMLDVEMPVLDGNQACARLRREFGDEVPIVMVTGMDDLESVERAFEAGATDFIAKPINLALIGHRVRYLFRNCELRQDLQSAHARNAAILDAIPDSLLRIDAGGTVLDAVTRSEARDDTAARALLPGCGERLADRLPADISERLLAAASRAHASGTTVGIDYALPPDSAGEHHYEARLAGIGNGETLCLVRDITARKLAEKTLRRNESLLRQAQSVARLGSWHLDLTTQVLEWSAETSAIFGLPPGTPLTYQRFLACVHPDDVERLDQAWQAALRGAPYQVEHRIRVGDEVRWLLERAEFERDDQACLVAATGTVQDITERKLQELEIISTRNHLRDTIDAIPDLLFEVDAEGRYLACHSPDDSLLAVPAEQIIGRTVAEVLPAAAAAICMAALDEARAAGRSLGRQIELPLADGIRWFELSVSCKSAEPGASPHFIVLSRDITERKSAERSIYRLAYFDPLTGLPNRQSFTERLDREIHRARIVDDRLAVLFLDLDGFKNINDTMGHGSGDRLLQLVADRLRQSVRPADLVARSETAAQEIDLARLGGDEFTLLIPQLRHSESALGVARRVLALLRCPFLLEGREVVVTASIGIALFPDDGDSAASLLKHADTAMYHAKDEGRDNCQFYSRSLTAEAMRRLDLETNLRLALERNEFFLMYQPQLDLASGRIKSLEALIRWRHPENGLVAPADFIPMAEDNGLIVPIGEWVLRTACAEAAAWHAAGTPLRVAVNLSAVQFRSPGLLESVRSILAASGLAPEWLELELTEGALMADSATALATLNALRQAGMQIALDDFGTGYSSLSYLKRLPLTTLKVDQSFVSGLPDDRESLAIVRAIVSLARNLGFSITAEGIETHEQARILHELACETLQGYYISRPVVAAAIPALLSRHWCLEEDA